MAPDLSQRDYRNILVIGSIGIGNLLMFRPTLKLLRAHFDRATISVLVLKDFFHDVFSHDPLVDHVIVADFRSYKKLKDKLDLIRTLRGKRYDLVITGFPANRLEYNVLSFLTGAPDRVGSCYPCKGLRALSSLQNVRIPVKMDTHDVIQNLGLLEPFRIRWDENEIKMEFPLTREDDAFAQQYYDDLGWNDSEIVIGIHPGSSEENQMVYKRWSGDKFSGIIRRLNRERNVKIVLFGGPAEEAQMETIRSAAGDVCRVVKDKRLRQVAALIKKCRLFLTNDSGLMHVAASEGVPVVSLFGPTDHMRTAPYGRGHRVVRTGIDCSPCWKLKDVGFRTLCIYPNRRCLDELSVDKVWGVVTEVLDDV